MFIGTVDAMWHTVTFVSVVKATIYSRLAIHASKVVSLTRVCGWRHKRCSSCTQYRQSPYYFPKNILMQPVKSTSLPKRPKTIILYRTISTTIFPDQRFSWLTLKGIHQYFRLSKNSQIHYLLVVRSCKHKEIFLITGITN